MNIQIGDMFRIKKTGEILEITMKLGVNEYRSNYYKADGSPDCGANGQHNTSSDIKKWYSFEQGLEKIKPLPSKRFLIRTSNYGNYYAKRFIVDNIEILDKD